MMTAPASIYDPAFVALSYKGKRNGVAITYPVVLLGSHKASLIEKAEATSEVIHAINAYEYALDA